MEIVNPAFVILADGEQLPAVLFLASCFFLLAILLLTFFLSKALSSFADSYCALLALA